MKHLKTFKALTSWIMAIAMIFSLQGITGFGLVTTKADDDSSNSAKSVIKVPKEKTVTITVTGADNKIVATGTSTHSIYSDGNVTICGTGTIEVNGEQFYTSVSTTSYEGNVTVNAIGKEGGRQVMVIPLESVDYIHYFLYGRCR